VIKVVFFTPKFFGFSRHFSEVLNGADSSALDPQLRRVGGVMDGMGTLQPNVPAELT
jgi:hypothetical protein